LHVPLPLRKYPTPAAGQPSVGQLFLPRPEPIYLVPWAALEHGKTLHESVVPPWLAKYWPTSAPVHADTAQVPLLLRKKPMSAAVHLVV
jgi:hypothetical protein